MAGIPTTLYNMFSNITGQNNTPAPAPAPALPVPGNIPPPQVTAVSTPATPATPASPMEPFAKLWETDPNAPKPTPATPMFNLDPKAMAAAAGQIDFRKSISPELATRMKAGGDDGMAAMMEAMNGMTQTVFAHSATASARLAEEAVKKAQKNWESKLPDMMKNQNLRNSLQENPALSNPAAAPLVAFATSQFQMKNPNASEAQLRQLVSEYFDGLANTITAQSSSNTPKPKVPKEQDFSDWA